MIALQREVFTRNQQRINRAVYGYTAAYRKYERDYHNHVATYQDTASFDELLQAVRGADIVYVGDYHTLAQAQRTLVRILRRIPIDIQPTIAVEFVQGRYQAALDAFMAGRIGDETFLKRIEHDPQGVFGAWDHFKPIFDLARDHRMPMVAIDLLHDHSSTSLHERDSFAAKTIVDAIEGRPNKPVFVHMGELHVAPSHLPLLVERELKARKMKPLRKVIIFQNCEEIYWKLEELGLEHTVEVVRVKPNQFCVITTPPIVCQQSYLNWLDNDDDLFEDAGPEKVFKEFVEIIARMLDIRVGEALDNVVLSSVVDVHFLETLRQRGRFSPRELEQIHRQVLSSESYFIPKASMVYLGKLSINHAAEEASHFLRHVCGGDEEPRYLVDAFYCRALNEAIGFVGSKLINHKRKCPHVRDFQRLLREQGRRSSDAVTDPFTLRIADFVVKHRKLEQGHGGRGVREMYTSDAETFNAVTHALGYILGDKLYYAMVQGIVSKNDVRELFFDSFEEDGAALTMYLALTARVEKVKLPSRTM